jgi:hypothetical protein
MIIVSRQLGDYLPGGKFNIDSSPNFEKLKETSVNVSTTNIVSERDFANLDRLRREKPNANTIALEGMILFTNNKTLHWLDNLDAEKKSTVLKARENAPKMLQNYKEQKHIEILQKKKDEASLMKQRKNNEIIKIKQDIDTYGGQWLVEKDIERALKNLSMSQKVEAIKSQIKYQKVVLKKNPEDKNLLKFSTEGNKLTLNQLLSNFRILANISISSIAVSDESALENGACNTEVNKSSLTIKTVEERENFMMQQREKILKKIQELKSKRNVVSERRKSESKKKKRH